MKQPQRNSFEMKAHDIQFKVNRPSWDHTIETYTKGKPDYFLMICCGALVLFGLIALATVYGLV